ncbi:hypothetical protein MA16_Dca015491 [Dendrobium catenatum]|uniref:FPL domain-containing protein n=1 Tax=Dendrobium catenatum TaxID=906689 RepID=A0A2I0X9Q4_9ASPA|nr:hypothetical protein MA16_Dca015491 [Dendrobium catenatum]
MRYRLGVSGAPLRDPLELWFPSSCGFPSGGQETGSPSTSSGSLICFRHLYFLLGLFMAASCNALSHPSIACVQAFYISLSLDMLRRNTEAVHRYLTEQLQKVQYVNELNKDFVIEALRSIAELITYGDQHDPSFFEFFMEKQIMGEFVRILKVSEHPKVALQLLQTMSIMIQNLRSEHAIYYIFSNEHINFLITYSFDFHNDELLSYYISFLRLVTCY